MDSALRECLGDDIGDPNSLITDLGKNGIAVGESLKTTNAAKGAVGLAAAVRLFCGWEGGPDGILKNGANTFGFVLPVDSFDSILGNKVELDGSDQTHLSDLLAVQLQVPENNSGDLKIRAISVEAKFRKKKSIRELRLNNGFRRPRKLTSDSDLSYRLPREKMVYPNASGSSSCSALGSG